jgi:hypothetical protein
MPLTTHPTDARIKCLAEQDLQEVARLHGRSLLERPCAPVSPEEQVTSLPANEAELEQSASSLLTAGAPEPDLIQKLSSLETKVVTLQEQLTQLALVLFQERERPLERRMVTLETIMTELVGRPVFPPSLPDLQIGASSQMPASVPHSPGPLNPAEQRARLRRPALIEYATDGRYVIVSSLEGELSLVPESPEWFEWLATISSFRFVGQSGRFTAYRESRRSGPTRTWSAHRTIHQRRYKHCLGVTDRLTIAWLEQMAATLQAYVNTL